MEIEDSYEHNIPGVFYITENIPTYETKLDFEKEFSEGCQCNETCLKDKCSCVVKSGAYYTKTTSDQDTLHYQLCIVDNEKPIFECNTSCKCYKSKCGHRLVQLGPRNKLLVKKCDSFTSKFNCASSENNCNKKHLDKSTSLVSTSKSKGLGLFTLEEILPQSFICEYAGEIISENEAQRRFEINKKKNAMNYIFCVLEHFGDKTFKTYIDPSIFGNIGRYINHSCNPNCNLVPVRVNSFIPKLCIFSKTIIQKGSEITYDYGTENVICEENNDKLKDCFCEEQNCKKFMPFCAHIK